MFRTQSDQGLRTYVDIRDVGCAFEEIDQQGNQGRFEKIGDEIFLYTEYIYCDGWKS